MRQPIIRPTRVFTREPAQNRPIATLEQQTREAVRDLGSQKLDPPTFSSVVRSGFYRAKPGEIVRCEPASGGSVTVLLPPPGPRLIGREVTVKKVNAGTDDVVTSVADGSDVDGAASVTDSTAHSVSVFVCDGATWWRRA